MKRIPTKLTVTILAIFLVALGALGGLNYWKARDIITDSITASMEEKAVGGASDIADWMRPAKRK
ncbi:MAG TPA: hypothetical protein VN521_05760 [Negativicutes bacterium]|nr:hypothetical protein [Negativicutes bacterium]